MADHDKDQAEAPEFEDLVTALLKVDPEGIIGAEGKAARKAAAGESASVEE